MASKTTLQSGGFALLEMMMAVTIAGIIAAATAKYMTDTLSAVRHAELRGDLETIREVIRDNLDCQATFEDYGIDPLSPAQCSSDSLDQKPPYLRMRRYLKDAPSGQKLYLTGPLTNGYARLGAWDLRVSCSAKERSLIVQAARIRSDGTAADDPLHKDSRPLKWNVPYGVVFGGDVTKGFMPLCYGKGALTGEIVMARQQYVGPSMTPQPLLQVAVTGPASAAPPRAAKSDVIINGASPPQRFHGILCDEKMGWKIVSCHVNTVGFEVNEDQIQKAADPSSGYTFGFDSDAWIDGNGCYTNEVDGWVGKGMIVNAPAAHPHGIAIQAVCVKVGN